MNFIEKIFYNSLEAESLSINDLNNFLFKNSEDFSYVRLVSLHKYLNTIEKSFFGLSYYTHPRAKIYKLSYIDKIDMFRPLKVNKKEMVVLGLVDITTLPYNLDRIVLEKYKYRKSWWLLPFDRDKYISTTKDIEINL